MIEGNNCCMPGILKKERGASHGEYPPADSGIVYPILLNLGKAFLAAG